MQQKMLVRARLDPVKGACQRDFDIDVSLTNQLSVLAHYASPRKVNCVNTIEVVSHRHLNTSSCELAQSPA